MMPLHPHPEALSMALVNLNEKPPTKILVVDDDPVILAITRKLLEADGFSVILAKDGAEGLQLFLQHTPDLVLTDYSMPGMSGAELTRQIRTAISERYGNLPTFVPVIVLTSMGETEVLKECLDAGAVEFLTKPFSEPELRTRIRSIANQAKAHAVLVDREAEQQAEIAVVKHVLSRLLEHSKATLPQHFVMETLPTRRINGDICAYHAGATGIHLGMICDPMGHGLMAGVSEIPTMDAFNSLAARDLPLPGIMAEMNRKLIRLLPFGRFSCVSLFRMDMHTGTLLIASAAMPDALVFHRDGTLTRFPSTTFPLGIMEGLSTLVISHHQLRPGDCFFACSDGLSDIVEEEELVRLFQEGGEDDFAGLVRGMLDERIHDRELYDDVSWCLWPFRPERVEAASHPKVAVAQEPSQECLDLHLRFNPATLNYHELGSHLVGFLEGQGVPRDVSQVLALLLSEAMINAVDHGLLGLDSAMKNAGLDAYEGARRNALATAPSSTVDLVIQVSLRQDDGTFSHVRAQITDPGSGFDWRKFLSEMDDCPTTPHGRGLLLLKTLARDLTYNETGNSVGFSLYSAVG